MNKHPKLTNDKKIRFTKDYISPTIIDSNVISKVNPKYLKDFKNEKTPISNGGKLQYNLTSLEGKNILKVIPYNFEKNNMNINLNNSKIENHNSHINNGVNFIGGSNNNLINNSIGNININTNNLHLNLNYNPSNQENSFITKPSSGSAIIYKKNQELNFSTKITDSNSSLRELIGAYSLSKKVNKYYNSNH